MVRGFKKQTRKINSIEKEIVPILIKGIWYRWGRSHGITAIQICEALESNAAIHAIFAKYRRPVSVKPERIRKLLHFIRTSGIVPNIVAFGDTGYFRTDDPSELLEYSLSLGDRISAIQQLKDSIDNYILKVEQRAA